MNQPGDAALTLEQKAANFDLMRHKEEVTRLIYIIVNSLLQRAYLHDQSKARSPEVEKFAEVTPKLHGMTFGSPEYKESLKLLEDALAHHYAHNRHHPEHWANGLDDMNLIDIIEMFCDWFAASKRHADGNMQTSIEKNAKRFDMSTQLRHIFENTLELFDGH